MGHSMGGLVASSLLPDEHISAVITMSTPHSIPPARFDSRMDAMYSEVQKRLYVDSTPILSICGGVTDTMIPSEFCTLARPVGEGRKFRKTVFTSSLEGCWSGVGHREMVWCHQVRWKVARALLDISAAHDGQEIADVLEARFSTGITFPKSLNNSIEAIKTRPIPIEIRSAKLPLTLDRPQATQAFRLAIPDRPLADDPLNLVIYVSRGQILSTSPANPLPFSATIRFCRAVSSSSGSGSSPFHCEPLRPSVLQLVPNPDPLKDFPVPHEGVDESDGVVAFKADISQLSSDEWILLEVESKANSGWLTASIEYANDFKFDAHGICEFS